MSRSHFLAVLLFLLEPAGLVTGAPSNVRLRVDSVTDLARECVALAAGNHKSELCYISPIGTDKSRTWPSKTAVVATKATLVRAASMGWLGRQHILVANLGLHHANAHYASIVDDFAEAYRQLDAFSRPQLIWRETSPQHFPTLHGWYESGAVTGTRSRHGHPETGAVACRPLGASNSTAHEAQAVPWSEYDWFNNLSSQILEKLAKELPGNVSILSVWAESVPRWHEHFGTLGLHSLDCTHYCMMAGSGVLYHWAAKLVSLVLRPRA
uniref:Uncharacterized protein n=1 Tax=Haptolina brevifila TaxID=156173 RepID=A0A7S2DAT0_9EUKA